MEQKRGYGILSYDEDGLPICHICGHSFDRLGRHVSLKHDMTASEYKKMFGLMATKGLISKRSAELAREKVYDHYDKVIVNLIVKGKKTRYESGHEGRTANKVREQGRLKLVEHARNALTKEKRIKIGRDLGKSGKGNAVRWKRSILGDGSPSPE